MSGASLLARLRQAVLLVPKALYKGGGLSGAAARAWAIYRDKGASGLLQSMRVLVRGSGPPLMADATRPDRLQYREWVKRHGRPLPAPQRRALLDALESAPAAAAIRFVIFLDAHAADAPLLARALESLRAQGWQAWSCRVAFDADDGAVAAGFEQAAARDARLVRDTGAADEVAADAEWWIHMDARDVLFDDALLWVAQAVHAHPQAELVYSDEDRITADGVRTAGYFKPAWNPDLLRSQDCMSRLGAFRARTVQALGGVQAAMGEARFYDLVLRVTRRVQAAQIIHVPRVLYHRHVARADAPDAMDPAEYVPEDGERALAASLAQQGVDATAERVSHGFRVRYALPADPPLVSLIIPTRNGLQLVRQCIESIFARTDYLRYEIVLVDNGSDDPAALAYFAELAQHPQVRVLRDDRPFNYSALNNDAAAVARGEVLGLINNDIEVISPGWLTEMVAIALQPGVGAVGARLWYPDRTLQHGGVVLGYRHGVADHAHRHLRAGEAGYFARADLMQTFSAVTAACLLVRRAHFDAVGQLDAENLVVAYNDVDFCLRLRKAGLRNVWTPYADLFHHESATRPSDASPSQIARFRKEAQFMEARWAALIADDPAYSPNLTLAQEDFSLAWPPRALPPGGRHG